MVLSRFWSFIIACSILYIFYLLATDRMYTLTPVVNGAQNDPVLKSEYTLDYVRQTDTALYAKLLQNDTVSFPHAGGVFILKDDGAVKVYEGKQSADGIFLTCKNTIMDLWLPLIGYLTF